MKHQTFMNIAKAVSQESKCISLKVGAVLVKDGHVVSTGYNGTPKGWKNCCDAYNKDFDREGHSEWSQKYEVHAELNTLLHCPVALADTVCYTTHSPCFNCLKHLIAAGVKEIYFNEWYHRMTAQERKEVVNFSLQNNIALAILTNSSVEWAGLFLEEK